jgi:hypothetical protein
MKQIKTITAYGADTFDRLVNEALAEGWELKRRWLLPPTYSDGSLHTNLREFCAEMEREIVTEAERTCENCLHRDKNPESEPCFSCSEDADKWEEALP